jgi:excisionase family DNA binding protein
MQVQPAKEVREVIMTDEKFLTVAQVAERLEIGQETVRRWIKSGKLHAVNLGGTKLGYRIPESEIERLLREARTNS